MSILKQLVVALFIALAFAKLASAEPARPVSHPSYGWMERDISGKPLTL
jgi:hypothetical protein